MLQCLQEKQIQKHLNPQFTNSISGVMICFCSQLECASVDLLRWAKPLLEKSSASTIKFTTSNWRKSLKKGSHNWSVRTKSFIFYKYVNIFHIMLQIHFKNNMYCHLVDVSARYPYIWCRKLVAHVYVYIISNKFCIWEEFQVF